jgi:limonene-1,2-epoxide hydrolase
LGNCVAGPDTPHDFIECDFSFIHVYDNPNIYDLSTEGLVAAGMGFSSIDGPKKTITIAERATSSVATSVQPALAATSTAEIIQRVVSAISWIIGSLLVLLIMIGGFTIITAAGDPKKVTKGKQIIVYAIIGFAIMVVSRGILELVYLILGINIP